LSLCRLMAKLECWEQERQATGKSGTA